MRPVLYIDVLFCVNWIMDAAVLILTGRLLKRRIRPVRTGLAAAAGALWVCVCAVLPLPGVLVRIGSLGPMALCMVWVSYRVCTVRETLRAILCLYLSAALLGGLIHAVYDNTALGRFWRLWMDGSEAGAVSVWLLALGAAGALGAAECMLRYREASRSREYIEDVTLTYRGRQLTVAALWDSGNQLYDPFTKKPVHILELTACGELLGEEACRYLSEMAQAGGGAANAPVPARLIPCSSLGNAHGLLPVLTLERLAGAAGFREEAPAVGFSPTPLSKEENYRMLLHSQADKKRRNQNDY